MNKCITCNKGLTNEHAYCSFRCWAIANPDEYREQAAFLNDNMTGSNDHDDVAPFPSDPHGLEKE